MRPRCGRWLGLGLVLGALLLGQGRLALACASCSSGGEEPLVLYPNERWKVLLGLARQGRYRHLEHDASRGYQDGPAYQDTATLALGRALGRDAFLTLVAPLLRRAGAGASDWGLGDLSINGRWTFLPQSIAAPWRPQLQLSTGYRLPTARPWGGPSQGDLGAPGAEARLGMDVWWGMHAWQLGLAAWALLPHGYERAETQVQPGRALRALLVLAYAQPSGRISMGLVREQRWALAEAGAPVPRSQVLQHSLFAALEAQLGGVGALRLTAAQAALFASYNTQQATSLSLAWIAAWS